jgi:hypothetical protein
MSEDPEVAIAHFRNAFKKIKAEHLKTSSLIGEANCLLIALTDDSIKDPEAIANIKNRARAFLAFQGF